MPIACENFDDVGHALRVKTPLGFDSPVCMLFLPDWWFLTVKCTFVAGNSKQAKFCGGGKNNCGYTDKGECKGCQQRFESWGSLMQDEAKFTFAAPETDTKPRIGTQTKTVHEGPKMHIVVLRAWDLPGDYSRFPDLCESGGKCGSIGKMPGCENVFACGCMKKPGCTNCLGKVPCFSKCKLPSLPSLPKIDLPDAPEMPSFPDPPELPTIEFPTIDWKSPTIDWASLPDSFLFRTFGECQIFLNGDLWWRKGNMNGNHSHALGAKFETGDVIAIHIDRPRDMNDPHLGAFAGMAIWNGNKVFSDTHWRSTYSYQSGWYWKNYDDGNWSCSHAFFAFSEQTYGEHKEGPVLPDECKWIWNWSTYDDAWFRLELRDPKSDLDCGWCNWYSWTIGESARLAKRNAARKVTDKSEGNGEGETEIRSEDDMLMSNPFVEVNYNGAVVGTTSVISKNRWPAWGEYFSFPFTETTSNNNGRKVIKVNFKVISDTSFSLENHDLCEFETEILTEKYWSYTMDFDFETLSGSSNTWIQYAYFYEMDEQV